MILFQSEYDIQLNRHIYGKGIFRISDNIFAINLIKREYLLIFELVFQ